jgi:hypothetical protein
MTVRRLGILQWLGLLAGAGAWAVAHVVGYGMTLAECSAGGAHWQIANDTWETALLSAAALCAGLAGAASALVLRATRDTSYEGAPPRSRIRFFAIAASATDAIFLVVLLLDLIANVFNQACRGA